MLGIAMIKSIVNSSWFQNSITGLILVNAALLGFETSPEFVQQYPGAIWWSHAIIQVLFLIEIVLRIAAFSPRCGDFFKNGWNLFDFTVVALSLLPQAGVFATVARLARILRIVRLVSISKELRLIVGTMLLSLPSMGHVILLLGMLLYVYAIIGHHFFSTVQPELWGTLGRCFLTLFQILTLEGWTDIQKAAMEVYPWAWLYFISFVVIAVFVVINLFIAVVTNNLQSVKELDQTSSDSAPTPNQLILELRQKLSELEQQLRSK
jgi:voltage-gated sodium channel